jgi:hypothetical protein
MSFNLDNYVTVNERLRLALEKFPDLRVHESEPRLIEAGGQLFIQVEMVVRRTADDLVPMVGYIWEEFPGKTPYTKGAEQPNAATSCLGRILGYMGFGITKSIASQDDVARREPKKETFVPQKPKVVPVTYPDGGPVPDPFTGEQQTHDEFPPGDVTKPQMGKIRALGKGMGVSTTKGLCERISPLIGRSIVSLDQLSKKEAGHVIESWIAPVIPDPAGEIPDPIHDEPF